MDEILDDEAFTEEFNAAKARGDARLLEPRAQSAHYDAGRNRIVVKLTTGIEIAFSPRRAQGLENASAAELRQIELTPAGLGLHFPVLDADIYVPGLLKGHLGTKTWMAELAAQDALQMRRTEKGRARPPGKRNTRAGKAQAA